VTGSGQLPQPVRAGLDAFAIAAQQVFGDDLVSIVLFGSAAEGRLRQTSDVNAIVVAARLDPAKLTAIGDAYRLAHAAIRLSVMFILETEIDAASEAFAVKFADIANRHEVLYGSDPFAGIAVPRQAAVRRLRQVLLNLILRLREHYALSSAYPEQLAMAAADAAGPLRACAAMLLFLETGAEVAAREALRQIAEKTGSSEALATIVEARETGGIPAAGADRALSGAIEIATELAARAERLRE
jgi:predicted nucleotidyltransferase